MWLAATIPVSNGFPSFRDFCAELPGYAPEIVLKQWSEAWNSGGRCPDSVQGLSSKQEKTVVKDAGFA
jgi:hypothetical protein